MNRLFFFCAEFTRRHPRPVQAISTSTSVHVLGFAVQRLGEDFEALVAELRERGLRDTQAEPEQWRYVQTTYREVEPNELAIMYGAVMSEGEEGRPLEVFPDSFGPDGEPLFDGRPATMTTPVRRTVDDEEPGLA